jgi:hypothetical protein
MKYSKLEVGDIIFNKSKTLVAIVIDLRKHEFTYSWTWLYCKNFPGPHFIRHVTLSPHQWCQDDPEWKIL